MIVLIVSMFIIVYSPLIYLIHYTANLPPLPWKYSLVNI